MLSLPLLSLIVWLPAIGALFIALIRGEQETVDRNSRHVALLTAGLTFLLSLFLWSRFDTGPGFQFMENHAWIDAFNIRYRLGVDGISLFFVILSAFLTPLCILSSWYAVQTRVREYMIAFLLLESLMIGMFCALDLFLFYIFFEGVLIPMVLIIGIWGGERRIYSAFKFFLYTLLGSVLMLLAMITIYAQTHTTDILAIQAHQFAFGLQKWLWLAFFVSFAVKVPMWPVHTWLPDAHVEAPTAGSVILAGVLLKMGGYGLLRFNLPFFPEASHYFAPLVIVLSLIAIVYTSGVALVQKDMKKLIAYSSIAHMGFVTLGIFTFNQQAVSGAMFQMLSHGVVSGALFLCVGVVYDRFHTREIKHYGGLVQSMPRYAFFFMLFTLASIGLPGTSGFVGEFLVILGTFKFNTIAATIAATAMVLGAAYGLWLYRRVVFGTPNTHLDQKELLDLTWQELLTLGVLGISVVIAGFYPNIFLKPIDHGVKSVLTQSQPRMPVESVFNVFRHGEVKS